MKKLTPHKQFLKSYKVNKYKILIAQIAILAVFLFVWESLTYLNIMDSFIFSSPSRILKTFNSLLKQKIFYHIGVTLLECIIGFSASTLAGVVIAIALWWSESLRKILEPYIVVLNSLPKIALGPIIIIWIGAGHSAIIAMAVLICIIVTIISVLNGFMSVDPEKILLLRSMGANKFQILIKLVLPYSVPNFISVLKVNVGLAWVGTIMGEYLVSGAGLGYLIIYGGQIFKMDLVMTSTVILCILAAAMYLIVSFIEKQVNRSR